MSDSKDSQQNIAKKAVIEISSVEELESYISYDHEGLVVLDWSAEWCAPCKRIAPEFEKLAQAEPSVKFLHADIDVMEEQAVKMKISSVPTFLFFKNGIQVDKVSGANITSIKNAVSNNK